MLSSTRFCIVLMISFRPRDCCSVLYAFYHFYKTSLLLETILSYLITHYSLVLLFYIPWKHQKKFRFSDVFRRYRKATPGCNGLRSGSHPPQENALFASVDDEKCILFRFKSSFRFQYIKFFFLTFWSFSKNGLIRNVRCKVNFKIYGVTACECEEKNSLKPESVPLRTCNDFALAGKYKAGKHRLQTVTLITRILLI